MDNHTKIALKIAMIARSRVLGAARGVKDADLARQAGLSFGGFTRLINSSEYKEVEAAILAKVTNKMDADTESELSLLRKDYQKHLVPLAMRRIMEIAKQDRDLRQSLEASREILDRDPANNFAKTTKVGLGGNDALVLPEAVLDALDKEATSVKRELDAVAMGDPLTEAIQ